MKKETLLATLGAAPEEYGGIVNLPPHRASTVLFPNLAAFEAAERGEHPLPTYARYGTASTQALEKTIAELEGADRCFVVATGMAAITTALFAFLKSGDHLLMVDSVYGPARRLCNDMLKRFGIETTYYDPAIGADIASLIRDNTKIVYVESPGSQTFEIQDIPAIAKAAHEKGAIVMGDCTWATPLYIKPFELGIDISIHSVTKYIGGHSDLMMGTISCKKQHEAALRRTFGEIAACASGDNCYLAMRGLRSLAARLKLHAENAMAIAQWLQKRAEVEAVLYPALPGAPGHALWKRDFSGATSLFSIMLKEPLSLTQLSAFFDGMELFGLGYSWGGFESLLIPFNTKTRVASKWPYKGQGFRLHIGLEHPDDMIRDLDAAFKRLAA